MNDVDYIKSFAQSRGFVCTRAAAEAFLVEHGRDVEARLAALRVATAEFDSWLTALLASWERTA